MAIWLLVWLIAVMEVPRNLYFSATKGWGRYIDMWVLRDQEYLHNTDQWKNSECPLNLPLPPHWTILMFLFWNSCLPVSFSASVCQNTLTHIHTQTCTYLSISIFITLFSGILCIVSSIVWSNIFIIRMKCLCCCLLWLSLFCHFWQPVFVLNRYHLCEQPSDSIHRKRREWDSRPGGWPISWRSPRQPCWPGSSHRTVDRYAELWLCGLHPWSLHRWTQ